MLYVEPGLYDGEMRVEYDDIFFFDNLIINLWIPN